MENYVTEEWKDDVQVIQLITVFSDRNDRAVEDYIKRYKPFLPHGANILTNGTIVIHGKPVSLGNISPNNRRFAFTYLAK